LLVAVAVVEGLRQILTAAVVAVLVVIERHLDLQLLPVRR